MLFRSLFAQETARGCVANGGLCVAPGELATKCDPSDFTQTDHQCPTQGSVCCVPNIVAQRG